jgi:drug/metabolite transporter (DMT)-like permease
VRDIALFALMSLIWGLTWAAVKYGLQVMPPLLLAAARYLLTAMLLLFTVRGDREAFVKGRAPRAVAVAVLMNAATYGPLFWGMQHVASGLSGLVNLSLTPIMLFVLAAATGEERPSWRHALALAIGLAGLTALFWRRLGEGSASIAGLIAIVVGTACYCVGSVLARPLVKAVPPLVFTKLQAAIGGSILLLAAIVMEPLPPLSIFVTWQALGGLAFLSILGTIVGFSIYLVLLRDWGTARAGLYAFVSPVVALGAGALLFGESVGMAEIGGAALLIVAAAVALLKPGAKLSP